MKIALYVPRWRRKHGGAHWAMLRLVRGLQAKGGVFRLYHDAPPTRLPYGEVKRWSGKGRFDAVLCAGGMPEDRFLPKHGAIIRNVHHSSIAHWAPYGKAHGIIWCSATYREHYYARGVDRSIPNIVSWPIVDRANFAAEPGDAVTLINPMPEKGGDLFAEIAARMPGTKFLAVEGGWNRSKQLTASDLPPNVEWMPYQTDIRNVWRKTRVLLYPLGRHAPADWIDGAPMSPVEAACAGIPTIATPQPGMVEVMGAYAHFVASHDPKDWETAITEVLAEWRVWSAMAKQKADTLDPDAEVAKVEDFIRSVA